MPIQILPRTPGFGEQLGTGLGTGLGKGLQLLTQMKLQDIARQRNIPGLQALGYSPEEAQGISQLDPTLQREVIKRKFPATEASPTYQTQIGKTFEKRLNRIIGGRQNISGDISEFAYSRLNDYVRNGINIRTATTQALKDAKDYFRSEQPITQEVSKGKKITNAVVDHFLKKAGNNPEEARRMASEAGYEV